MSGKYLDSSKEVGTKALQVAGSLVSKGTKALATYAGEALSACETKKAAADIQAKGELYNLERRAMREMPVLALNQVQANQLGSQTFNGFGMYPGPIQLDHSQADAVMHHMLKQYALDPESSRELVKAVAPLVGIPNMMCSAYSAHRFLADTIIIPVINERRLENNNPCINYRKIVESPLYWGDNQGVVFQYNIHSITDADMVKQQYDRGGQCIEQMRKSLKDIGIQIGSIESEGILLKIRLKWTGV